MKKNTKIILIVVGCIFAYLILMCGIIWFFSSGFNDKYEITTETSKYKEVITGEKWGMSEEVFPSDITGLNVVDFKHIYYDPWDANYLAYLVVDYDGEMYNSEIARLNEIGISEYKGYYGVSGFSNYELVAIVADDYHGFVYALTDGNSKIIYVEMIFCNYYMDIDYSSNIPNEYLPDGFDAEIDNPYMKSKGF